MVCSGFVGGVLYLCKVGWGCFGVVLLVWGSLVFFFGVWGFGLRVWLCFGVWVFVVVVFLLGGVGLF